MLIADLTGKTAFITGASSGLGRHFAHVLSKSGARVALAARRFDALQVVAGEIANAGGRALPVVMDVRERGSVQDALSSVIREFDRVDILVNNSGVAVAPSK